jgi:hypothetical protein
MKTLYAALFFAALISSPMLLAQTVGTLAACDTGYHAKNWERCPMNDVGGEPKLPCEQVSVCLPNCPKTYREARNAFTSTQDLSCVPAKQASLCSPVRLQLFWARQLPVVWHWRVEISEKCAISRLRTSIHLADDEVAEGLHGKALGQFQVVVGKNGKVADSTLMWGTPSIDFKRLTAPTVLSRLAADTLRQLRFRPYLFQGQPAEFQTTITIPFQPSRTVN